MWEVLSVFAIDCCSQVSATGIAYLGQAILVDTLVSQQSFPSRTTLPSPSFLVEDLEFLGMIPNMRNDHVRYFEGNPSFVD